MEPSSFLLQHVSVEMPRLDERTFRPWWIIRTQLDRLLRDGAISEREWRAAIAFRDSVYTTLAASWPARCLEGGSGGGIPGRTLDVSLDALARVRRINAALGRAVMRIVYAVVVDNVTWAELGRLRGIDPKTARSWSIEAIKMLAAVPPL
jgi:hypothetical protein